MCMLAVFTHYSNKTFLNFRIRCPCTYAVSVHNYVKPDLSKFEKILLSLLDVLISVAQKQKRFFLEIS